MPDHPATTPSKKRLGFPVSAEALRALCHPCERHTYHAPVLLPSDQLAACNGWLAVTAHKFALPAPTPASPTFLARWDDGPPWGAKHLWTDSHGTWKPLDDVAGMLWRYGPKPIWEKGSLRWHLRHQPAVLVGTAAVVPLGLLQLASRLPRAEVQTETIRNTPLRIRFNGGRGLMHNHIMSNPKRAFRIFAPKEDPI